MIRPITLSADDAALVEELRGVTLFQSYDYNLALNNRAADRITALSQPVPSEASVLADIAAMMGEFVDNWPEPKRVKTALALIAKTIRAMLTAGENSDGK